MFLALLFLFGLISAAYAYLTWNFEYWKARGVLSPKPKVVFGNFSKSNQRKRHVNEDITEIYNEYKFRANFVGIYQMRTPRVLVLTPELVKEVLIKSFKNFRENEFSKMFDEKYDPLFARNPFLSRGDDWKERRTEISPAFSSNRMKALFPLIESVCKKLTSFIKEEFSQPLELRDLCGKYTMEAVSKCILGIEANSLSKEDSELRKMAKKLSDPSFTTILKIMTCTLIPAMKDIVGVQFVPDDVNKFFLDLIKQAVDYRVKHGTKREDYLDYLITLQKKKGFSSTDLAGHSITFFTDGLETSSIAIAFTLYELAKNGHVQEKLRQEIKEFIHKHGAISYDVQNDMPYLDQVMNESLRMHPPFTFISKECTESIELEYQKGQSILIEKGLNVYLPIYQLQRDAEYYPKPNEFIPERFGGEHGGVKAFKDKGVLLTFGEGPRSCLGMKFALMQSKAAIVEVLRNFRIFVNDKTEPDFVMDPKEFMNIKRGGMWLNFSPIKVLEI